MKNNQIAENNKSPGPYDMPVEFCKCLNDDNLEEVREILNKCWDKEIMPDELELAELVTLYKEGNVEDPSNYRPISLLNTFYKLYTSIIQNKFAERLDESLWKIQFGFRKTLLNRCL